MPSTGMKLDVPVRFFMKYDRDCAWSRLVLALLECTELYKLVQWGIEADAGAKSRVGAESKLGDLSASRPTFQASRSIWSFIHSSTTSIVVTTSTSTPHLCPPALDGGTQQSELVLCSSLLVQPKSLNAFCCLPLHVLGTRLCDQVPLIRVRNHLASSPVKSDCFLIYLRPESLRNGKRKLSYDRPACDSTRQMAVAHRGLYERLC